jgi:hypothetical protein
MIEKSVVVILFAFAVTLNDEMVCVRSTCFDYERCSFCMVTPARVATQYDITRRPSMVPKR